MDASLQLLLRYQEHDLECRQIEDELRRVPVKRQTIDKNIAEQERQIEAKRQQLRDLELKRKQLDQDLAATEEKIVQYKTQQFQVKKNEEYRALTHEIEALQEKVGQIEDESLALLDEIEAESRRAKEAEKANRAEIERLQHERALVDQREPRLKDQLREEQAKREAAAGELSRDALATYQRVQTIVKRGPWVVPIVDQKCKGCHLRISNDIVADARNREKLVFCDQCARIVYVHA